MYEWFWQSETCIKYCKRRWSNKNVLEFQITLEHLCEPIEFNVMWCDVIWCDDVMCYDVVWCHVMWCHVMWCDVGSVGIETSILPEGDTFFSFRLCIVIFPAKATNNPHGLRMRLTIGVSSRWQGNAKRWIALHDMSHCMTCLHDTSTSGQEWAVWDEMGVGIGCCSTCSRCRIPLDLRSSPSLQWKGVTQWQSLSAIVRKCVCSGNRDNVINVWETEQSFYLVCDKKVKKKFFETIVKIRMEMRTSNRKRLVS